MARIIERGPAATLEFWTGLGLGPANVFKGVPWGLSLVVVGQRHDVERIEAERSLRAMLARASLVCLGHVQTDLSMARGSPPWDAWSWAKAAKVRPSRPGVANSRGRGSASWNRMRKKCPRRALHSSTAMRRTAQ